MLFNLVVGFLIPWIFGIFLYKWDKRILLIVTPFSSAISDLANVLGTELGFWAVKPLEYGSFSYAVFDLGLFALDGSFLVFFVHRLKFNPFWSVLMFTSFSTLIEFFGISLGKVLYFNEWNIFWTFWSYLIPYIIVYLYYLLLKKAQILI